MEEAAVTDEYAAIIAGPRWWGESQTDRDGNPVEKARAAERKLEANREREIMQEIVDDLPVGTFVIQGGARGADSLAASLCTKRGVHIGGVPYFGSEGKRGGYLRNRKMGQLLNGLKLQGAKVKVIAVTPPDGFTSGTKMMVDIAKEFEIYVKVVPYTELAPEPTNEETVNA
jgi:hypothetical protein